MVFTWSPYVVATLLLLTRAPYVVATLPSLTRAPYIVATLPPSTGAFGIPLTGSKQQQQQSSKL
jgi:hypothetical protein